MARKDSVPMNTFEFDGEKYKKASRHQKEWGNSLSQSCLCAAMKPYWIWDAGMVG